MSMLPNASHNRQLLEQTKAASVYLGIVATFCRRQLDRLRDLAVGLVSGFSRGRTRLMLPGDFLHSSGF